MKFNVLLVVYLVAFSAFTQQLERTVLSNWENGQWENCMQQFFRYNNNGELIQRETELWNPHKMEWKTDAKTTYVRDEQGTILLREEFEWDEQEGAWKPESRLSYSLNDQQLAVSVLTEIFRDGQWMNLYVDEYAYNSEGEMVERYSQRWDAARSRWIPSQKYIYQVDETMTTAWVVLVWNATDDDWLNNLKVQNVYNEHEKLDYATYARCDGKEWKDRTIRVNSYNESGNLESYEVFQVEEDSAERIKSNLVEYGYGSSDELTEMISKKWEVSAKNWNNLQKTTYSYHSDSELISTDESNALEVFPNPTRDVITIASPNGGKMTVLDASGKAMLDEVSISSEEVLDLSEWPTGVYTIQVSGVQAQQFIKY